LLPALKSRSVGDGGHINYPSLAPLVHQFARLHVYWSMESSLFHPSLRSLRLRIRSGEQTVRMIMIETSAETFYSVKYFNDGDSQFLGIRANIAGHLLKRVE